jgi:hypothetical protein
MQRKRLARAALVCAPTWPTRHARSGMRRRMRSVGFASPVDGHIHCSLSLAKRLDSLRQKSYQLFFWVIQHKYGTSEAVAPEEITVLRRFGKVEVLAKQCEASGRAKKFKSFVKQVVLG